MTPLDAALIRIATDLDSLGVRWALIGALALAARAEPRQTTDVDVAMLVGSDHEAESVIRTLLGRGYSVFSQLEQKAGGRLAGMRLLSPGADLERVTVDLLFAFSGIEPEVVEAAELLEVLPGLSIPVVRLGHLLALKVLAAEERRKDLVDIPLLLAVADEKDLLEARKAVDLIARRPTYQGDRDLVEALTEHVREFKQGGG